MKTKIEILSTSKKKKKKNHITLVSAHMTAVEYLPIYHDKLSFPRFIDDQISA